MNQPNSTFTRPRDFNAIGSKTQFGASFHNDRLCRFVLTCLTTADSKPPASSAAEPTLVQRLTVVFASLLRSQLRANSSSAAPQQSNRSQGAPRGASSGRADFAIVSQVEPSPLSKHTTDDASQRGWSRLHDDPPPYRG
ncbi:hypothetical protein MRS44_012556 [Fusarium solani]|uniref:uncharacterized protein n=1 Tax=Fusarium solani TaxID=169388 RepID=UPI0032C4797C|nr:hypothetical protein MRS44_012556 [Fusarium solani]